MSDDEAYTLPAPDAPAEEWGRLAVSLPGWRWMPGMRWTDPDLERGGRIEDQDDADRWTRAGWDGDRPDPDDPATAGCLLALLGDRALLLDLPTAKTGPGLWRAFVSRRSPCFTERLPLGRACIAAASALGRWPGGEG